jgi:hypothetical protein
MSSAAEPAAPRALSTHSRFAPKRFMIRRKFLKLFGGAFHIFDEAGSVVFYSKMKAFKLKEDLRLYTGEDMQHEVLSIRARSILDFGATYDVVDSTSGEKVGALRRKALRSVLRDEWLILDASDREVGKTREDSLVLALVRRLLTNLVPQTFVGTLAEQPVFVFKQHFNPFVAKIDLDFSMDAHGRLDRRLGIAAAVLMCAIEGRQQ